MPTALPAATAFTDAAVTEGAFKTATTNMRAAFYELLGDNSTGQILAPAGAVGAPGIAIAGDPDSGIYRIGANNLGIAVNGAKVLDIGTSGLGIVGGLTGTVTNDSAAAGKVGEVMRNTLGVGTNLVTTAVYQNVASLNLTAGDWDVTGVVTFALNGATVTNGAIALSAYSANTVTDHVYGDNVADIPPPTATTASTGCLANWRVSLAAPATIYLKASGTYSAGNPQIGGRISARRVR
jgi:hypothetical protein